MLLDAFGEPVVKTRDVMRRVERVHVTKATRDAVIFEDVDTGLSRYPIAWGNWERQKNQYHGRALVTGLVPVSYTHLDGPAARHESRGALAPAWPAPGRGASALGTGAFCDPAAGGAACDCGGWMI